MKVSQIDSTNFMAGTVCLKRVKPNEFASFDAIKKIAEEKEMDILITKHSESKFLPKENLYTVIASKKIPIITRGFFKTGSMVKHGTSCMLTGKEIQKNELSVKIFNAVFFAVENLERKLGNIR